MHTMFLQMHIGLFHVSNVSWWFGANTGQVSFLLTCQVSFMGFLLSQVPAFKLWQGFVLWIAGYNLNEIHPWRPGFRGGGDHRNENKYVEQSPPPHHSTITD